MPTLKIVNVKSPSGELMDTEVESEKDLLIDGKGKLVLFPALIDPHVHFRVPGQMHKEDFASGARAALYGGTTTVFDMPNNIPPIVTETEFLKKKSLIDEQLKKAGIPLKYKLFFGASDDNLDEILKVRKEIIGIKVFLGCSTNGLYVHSQEALEKIFNVASQNNLIVAVHAEDQDIIEKNKQLYAGETDVRFHSKIRAREAAITAVKKTIELANEYGTEIYFCHVSTKEEVDLIADAKKRGLLVYLEVTPQHLFLTEDDYGQLGTLAQMNPPLRTKEDQEALWNAIRTGVVDTIGTDHAPHTIEEKSASFPHSPSGMPGVETRLPLLLNAHHEGLISLTRIVELTKKNVDQIFNLKPNQDFTLVDLDQERIVDNNRLKTKCGWSPFAGRKLKGWPVMTILDGNVYELV